MPSAIYFLSPPTLLEASTGVVMALSISQPNCSLPRRRYKLIPNFSATSNRVKATPPTSYVTARALAFITSFARTSGVYLRLSSSLDTDAWYARVFSAFNFPSAHACFTRADCAAFHSGVPRCVLHLSLFASFCASVCFNPSVLPAVGVILNAGFSASIARCSYISRSFFSQRISFLNTNASSPYLVHARCRCRLWWMPLRNCIRCKDILDG